MYIHPRFHIRFTLENILIATIKHFIASDIFIVACVYIIIYCLSASFIFTNVVVDNNNDDTKRKGRGKNTRTRT